MCSIAIPSEHILGHSPPVYSSLLYSSLMVTTPPIATRSVPPRIRPCLSTGSIHLDGLLKTTDDVNKRNKKKVVFADDRGRPLTQVRVMSEPSNVPPLWTTSYVTKLVYGELFQNYDISNLSLQNNRLDSNGLAAKLAACEISKRIDQNQWEVGFAQPASDYLAFRHKLDKNSVSLENVIIKESENLLIGTVKVKNLAYNKEVVLRISFDSWISYKDLPCTYVEQPGMATQAAVRNLYDTFKFQITLPPLDSKTSSLEFCVRFTTDGCDYWDNNESKNYSVFRKPNVTREQGPEEHATELCTISEKLNEDVDENADILLDQPMSLTTATTTTTTVDADDKLINEQATEHSAIYSQDRTWGEFKARIPQEPAPYW